MLNEKSSGDENLLHYRVETLNVDGCEYNCVSYKRKWNILLGDTSPSPTIWVANTIAWWGHGLVGCGQSRTEALRKLTFNIRRTVERLDDLIK
jgi:hypothetical protein